MRYHVLFTTLEKCNLLLSTDRCHVKEVPTHKRREDHPTTQRKTSSSTNLLIWRDQTSPSFPNFKHKSSKQSLWIYCPCNPCWVQGELKGRGLQVRANVEDEKHGVQERKASFTDGSLWEAQHEVKESQALIVSSRNNETSREETAFALVALLKACAKQKDLHRGSKLHTDIVRMGLLEKNFFLGSILVSMYAKCGALDKAQIVFDELPVADRDVVSWTALIAGYAQHDFGEKALHYFEQMQLSGLSPNAYTFTGILKACGSIGDLHKGEEIHAHIVREHSLLESNIVVANALLDMYAKCGALEKAQDVFDELLVYDVVSWNVLISGYAQQGLGENALECLERMRFGGFSSDAFTFACLLKACGSIGALEKGQEIHAQVVKEHLLDKNIVLGNALVDMYAKCGALETAQDVFNKLSARNLVSWNTLITGYVEFGWGEEALNCFEQMRLQGITPNAVTFACILKACGTLQAVNKGQKLHTQIVREHLLEKDLNVGTVLVDMYVKCGAFEKAQQVFDELPARDVVAWNVLMAGYLQYGHDEKALKCFEWMQVEDFCPNEGTCASILKICGSIGAAYKGQKLHAHIVRCGFLEQGKVGVGVSVIAMYANCGMLEEAQELFNRLPVRGAVSWGALIDGYVQLGKDEIVFNLFDRMVAEGIEPDAITFISVLNICSHKGLVDKGQMYFKLMSKGYSIIPTLEHYNCMVDIFGRAGLLDKAITVIEKMSLFTDFTLWRTMLGACQTWECMKLGIWVFERVVLLNEKDAAV